MRHPQPKERAQRVPGGGLGDTIPQPGPDREREGSALAPLAPHPPLAPDRALVYVRASHSPARMSAGLIL